VGVGAKQSESIALNVICQLVNFYNRFGGNKPGLDVSVDIKNWIKKKRS
jgi:hypothetical protein